MDRGAPVRPPTAVEAGALVFQGLFVTVLGFLAWYTGVERLGADRIAECSALRIERPESRPPP